MNKKMRPESRAERLIRTAGTSRRTLQRWSVFAQAVDTLAALYGDELRHAILDGKTKLSNDDIMLIAGIARLDPQAMEVIAYMMKVGNAALLQDVVADLKRQNAKAKRQAATAK